MMHGLYYDLWETDALSTIYDLSLPVTTVKGVSITAGPHNLTCLPKHGRSHYDIRNPIVSRVA